jgi:hypothetical protein
MTPPGYEDENGSWDEFRLLVMHELKRANEGVDELNKKVQELETTHAQYRGAASMFGGIAGAIMAVIVGVVSALFGRNQ